MDIPARIGSYLADNENAPHNFRSRFSAQGWAVLAEAVLAARDVIEPPPTQGAVDLDALVSEVAERLAASSSLDEATAWNLLYPPGGALAPLMPHLRGTV